MKEAVHSVNTGKGSLLLSLIAILRTVPFRTLTLKTTVILIRTNGYGFQQTMKTLVVFVDLTKAFDKVWEDALLLKLSKDM